MFLIEAPFRTIKKLFTKTKKTTIQNLHVLLWRPLQVQFYSLKCKILWIVSLMV